MIKVSLLVLFYSVTSLSQIFRLGLTADFLVDNKYLNYEFGPAIVIDYSIEEIPVSIQAKTRFYLSELSGENNFSTGYTRTVSSIVVNIIYNPINWDIEPYIGLGIAYNFNDLQISGNVHPSVDGTIHLPGDLKNSLSTEVTGGLRLSAKTPINFIVEVTQNFNKPNHGRGQFNFNSLFLKLGLLFQI